ncbi:guanylate kinase [bacterium]|nr:guanylate kinase [bacterium]
MSCLYVISGSSGVGKGTVIREFLAKHQNFKLSVSCTTRAPRPREVDGKDYFFISRETFDEYVKNDEFIEHAEFSGNCYGTRKKFVQACLDKGENVILEIDTQGAFQIKEKMPEAVLIFMVPPSFEILEQRLRNRGTETEEAIQKRLAQVKREMESSYKFDYTLENDTIENAVSALEEITNAK